MHALLKFAQSLATTIIAVTTVIVGASNYLADELDHKIQDVSEQVARKTFEVFRVEDAVFQLDKEHDKFVNGKADSIRKSNLELVLKYKDAMLKTHPNKRLLLAWAERFYKDNFIEKAS